MASIKKIIQEIERKPVMYIGKRSVFTLKAFLDGWVFREINTVEDIELMNGFQMFIENKYNTSHVSQSWDNVLLFYSNDEYDALLLFFKNFNEYLLINTNTSS